MIETIFRESHEVYNKTEIIETPKIVTDTFFDDLPMGHETDTRVVSTDLDGFKYALKNKISCGVRRETIVVEKDSEKNIIQIKKYWAAKTWKHIKNINAIK